MFRMVARETCLGFELAWSAQATESVKVSADAQRIAAVLETLWRRVNTSRLRLGREQLPLT